MVFNFPHGIPSLVFNATISPGVIVTTSLIREMSLIVFFSDFVKDFTKYPVCLEASVPVAISIFLRIILFRLISVRLQHSSVGL